jgi:hypothetical protein
MSSGKATWGDRQDGLPPPPAISKSNEHFEAMGLEFVESLDGIKITDLNELFEKVGAAGPGPHRGGRCKCGSGAPTCSGAARGVPS